MIVTNSPLGVVYIQPIVPPRSTLFEGVAPGAVLPIPSPEPLHQVVLFAGKRRMGRKRFRVDSERAEVTVTEPPANGEVLVAWTPRPRWRSLGPVTDVSMEVTHG